MKTMMWLGVASVFGGCVDDPAATSSTEQAAGSEVVVHSAFNGGMAGVGYWDPVTGSQFSLNAYENKLPQGRLAHLSFGFFGVDPTSLECPPWAPPWDPAWGPNPFCHYTRWLNVWGMGTIPNEDFEVHPTGRAAKLHTTTGPDFFVQTCTQTGCTLGDPYTFDLVFTGNGFMYGEQHGTRVFSMGVPDMNGQILQIRESGSVTMQGATVNGSAFERTISNGFGQLMQANTSRVTRDLVRTTP